MILRFNVITSGLYRGSAPKPQDVVVLHDKYDIKKIVSLDQASGDNISKACKMLGIKQVMLPLVFSKASLLELLSYDLKDLLISGGPTFVHCYAGKDRTGLVTALFKCKYMGKDPEVAIKEAKSLGFGVGVDPEIVLLYEKVIRSCKPSKDVNSADIVSNVRDDDNSYLAETGRGSFAPYLDGTKQYPYDSVYNWVSEESPNRENYSSYKSITEHDKEEEDSVPLVGLYNGDSSGRGSGPTGNFGGFIND